MVGRCKKVLFCLQSSKYAGHDHLCSNSYLFGDFVPHRVMSTDFCPEKTYNKLKPAFVAMSLFL